jgi:hypothetical protein
MPNKHSQREQEARENRISKFHDQLSSGTLTVRQMTEAERCQWDAHSATSDARLTPDERLRRDRALEKKRDREERRKATPGSS